MKKFIITALVAGAAASSLSAAIVKVGSAITSDTIWSASNEYILQDIIFVNNNATLTIEPGTVIRGEPKTTGNNDAGTLVITRSGNIDAEGAPNAPIIFTTATLDSDGDGEYSDESYDYSTDIDYDAAIAGGAAFLDAAPKTTPLLPGKNFSTTAADETHLTEEYRGLWGGVVILGSAPTSIVDISTVGDVATATTKNSRSDLDDVFEGFIEGLDPAVTLTNDGVYGGTNPNDSSGTFKYVSIRHGGTVIGTDNELNGLTMGAVGHGTLIEYVEVYCNEDDGFEWFGGTVNTRFLVSLYNNDDSFDIDEGFQGLGQFWFSAQLDDGQNGDHGGEHDGTDAEFSSVNVASINGIAQGTSDAGAGLPMAYVTVYNATYIGSGAVNPNTVTDSGKNNAFRIRDSWGGAYFNSVFTDFGDGFIRIDTDGQKRVDAGDVIFRSNIIYNTAGGDNSYSNPVSGTEITTYAFPTATAPSTAANNNLFGTDPLNSHAVRTGIDPRASLAASAAWDPEPTTATYFTTASYPGAFNPQVATKWTDSWSVFGLQFD